MCVCFLSVFWAEPTRSSESQARIAKGRLWAGGRRRTDDEGTEWWGAADSTPKTPSFHQWWTSGDLASPILQAQEAPRPSSGDCASFEVVYMFTLATNCSYRLPFLCMNAMSGTPRSLLLDSHPPCRRDEVNFDGLSELT